MKYKVNELNNEIISVLNELGFENQNCKIEDKDNYGAIDIMDKYCLSIHFNCRNVCLYIKPINNYIEIEDINVVDEIELINKSKERLNYILEELIKVGLLDIQDE